MSVDCKAFRLETQKILDKNNPSNITSSSKKSAAKFGGAAFVAFGIILSRISGLVRQRVFAYYFGNSDQADAFYSAFKIPNFLQNLFGEGVLSASFIPVYCSLLAKNDEKEAGELAGTVASLLVLITCVLVLLGFFLTPILIDFIAPGFTGEKRELTIRLVQIFFPATGLLVLSAWCLGILNSHRRFFLPYAAPIISNAAIIVALATQGLKQGLNQLAVYTAWGVVIGSLLQLLIQLPVALKLVRSLKFGINLSLTPVKKVFHNFVPVVTARGVVQLSAYIDNVIASYMPSGAVAALSYAQALYMLPISLFGMSISAAELPVMSSAQGSQEEIFATLQKRLQAGLTKIAFFVIPSVVAFIVLGDVIISALYQTGKFDRNGTVHVWGVLIGSTVGLLAGTWGRLYSSAFYSLQDTRKPLKFALVRVFLTTVLGYLFGITLPHALHIDLSWGTAGLTASAGLAGWVEFMLLRRALRKKLGQTTGTRPGLVFRLWISALGAAALGWLIHYAVGNSHPWIGGAVVLLPYGIAYLALTHALGITEAQGLIGQFTRRRSRNRSNHRSK